jgi:dipeptidase E
MSKIFVMGGGGFSMEPDNPLLDQYALSLTQKNKPKVCFLATASGDNQNLIQSFYTAFNKFDCTTAHLSLFNPSTRDIESFILNQDLIYVGGGNTKNLLSLWKEWNLDKILKQAHSQGTVLAGLSAGMICWFEQGVTDSFGKDQLDVIPCLGFLSGSACPHFDGEVNRRPYYTQAVISRQVQEGLALDDGAGALFIDGKLQECVSSRPQARAFYIHTDHETTLPIRFLG